MYNFFHIYIYIYIIKFWLIFLNKISFLKERSFISRHSAFTLSLSLSLLLCLETRFQYFFPLDLALSSLSCYLTNIYSLPPAARLGRRWRRSRRRGLAGALVWTSSVTEIMASGSDPLQAPFFGSPEIGSDLQLFSVSESPMEDFTGVGEVSGEKWFTGDKLITGKGKKEQKLICVKYWIFSDVGYSTWLKPLLPPFFILFYFKIACNHSTWVNNNIYKKKAMSLNAIWWKAN
jgi:hypothetical protein